MVALGALGMLGLMSLGTLLRADTGGGAAKTVEVPPREGKSETITLFDGKSLDGWEGYEDHWSVVDGVIVGKNTKPVPVSTYLLTKKKFSDFRLHAKVKQVKSKMHSGIAFWGKVLPEGGPHTKARGKYTYAGHLVMFPFHWSMYDLFGRNGLPVDGGPARKVGSDTEWNDLIILAQGNRVRLVVNGTLVVDWRDPEPKRILEGPIGLQLHSNNVEQEVHFKDLEITTFPSDKDIPKKIGEKMKKE
jgi:hypothetical protein